MIKRTIFIFSLLLFVSSIYAQPYLMHYPDVSETDVVFTWENDLWLVPVEGGIAKRITKLEGREEYAKFSPDGKWIAFTGSYDGGRNVYIMPKNGGVPVQLTWHPSSDVVLDWSPDGKEILFRSRREYPFRNHEVYLVPIDGGTPRKLPVDRAGLASLSPDGKSLAYNRGSRESRTWKRHQGGTAQDIWVGNMEKMDYHKITSFEGTDNFPMWKDNFIYFTSDRNDGTLNLFRYDLGKKDFTALTKYDDYDIKFPSVGPNHIVYVYEEELYLHNLASGKDNKVNIEIPSDGISVREDFISAAENVGHFGLSPNGKRAILDVRGEIIDFPVEEGIVYNLTQKSGSREKNPTMSPDGKQIAFFSDKTGDEELYVMPAKGGDWKQLTDIGGGFKMQPKWSPDSKYLIYHDKFMKLNLVEAATGDITLIDQGEYDEGWYDWGIQDYSWSPDSRWVAYAKLEKSVYQSVFLYSLDKNETYRVTMCMTKDWSPSFSKDGKYLYFLSNRTFEPIMGFVDQNHIFMNMTKPYALILKEGDPAPNGPANIFDDTKEEESPSRAEKLVIDTDNMTRRIVPMDVDAGNLFRLEAVDGGFLFLKKEDNEFLKYQYVTDATPNRNHDLYKYDLAGGSASELISGINQYHLSADGKSLIYKSGNTYGVTGIKPGSVGAGKLNLRDIHIEVNKTAEFTQIYDEAWRVQRDFFYDKNMHGLNWEKTGDKYRKFVKYCGTREDLNYLIGELIGELNAGHTYIYGGEHEGYDYVPIGLLGIDLYPSGKNDLPRIERIIKGQNWSESAYSPLDVPGCPIKADDYILAIDGNVIGKGENLYKFLRNKAGAVVEITYNSKPEMAGAKKYLAKTLRSEATLKYNEWVWNNFKYVYEKTDGEVGYVHIPNMMDAGLVGFARMWYPQYYKKGMIIDVRANGGGFVSKMIIDRLERTMNMIDQPREGKAGHIPERAFYGHMVLLMDYNTGSDGELFSESWKYLNLGPIIGQRTWGGAVGIEPHQGLIDGAATTPPQFGKYNFDSKWVIEGVGVIPDIEVINMPGDVMKGIDAQLDKALEVVQDKIKTDPKKYPAPAKYPDKSKPTLK